MSTALRLIQDVRPPAEPHFWSYYFDSSGKARENLSRDDIANALRTGHGTLWVDVDTRSADQVAFLSDVFHFHPLAIEEAVNAESRVKLEEYDNYLLLIVRTVAFCETTDDPYDLDTVNIALFLGPNYLVTVHGADTNPVSTTAELLHRKPELVSDGPARLMHAIVIYFRDIYDHVLRIYDSLENYRDLLSSTLDSYLTQVSNRLGMATKALSVVATVTLPFVVVSGMWGMNFERIPLHNNPNGFMILVLAQLALGLLILAALRWRNLL